ncbi:histone-lysine N-methyltransferase SETMAR [Elysia marginata]|uniref:Histone-lysine N-methyltransferase SETMAR n=1 Tax=Elysia marginata TaxID=1093978 RepID=A0AAV4EW05_9GAST|nr:histone-lysine N-methyltransferase SETMAR [Elysia marginata]
MRKAQLVLTSSSNVTLGIKVSQIALKLDMSRNAVHEIVHETLGYLKVSARWVPKMLTEDHKLQRVEISRRLLLPCQQDNGDEDTTHIRMRLGGDFQAKNNLFDNLITGDKTWVHLNTSETKRDSMTWKHPSSPMTKKFKVQRAAAKVIATVFRDAKSVILLNILPQGVCPPFTFHVPNSSHPCLQPKSCKCSIVVVTTKEDENPF